jgi:rhodanese-related sulfurtransferase
LSSRRTIGLLLDEARAELAPLDPREAHEAALEGALLVDVRSLDEQARQGVVIPLAVHHPLSVVLWRLDPAVDTSNPKPPLESRIVLICREGYCSGLAAQQLRQIGFRRATDVAGGVDAWVAAGLPTVPFADRLRRSVRQGGTRSARTRA